MTRPATPTFLMPSTTLRKPGDEGGMCFLRCQHPLCQSTLAVALTICRGCGHVIGFERPFLQVGSPENGRMTLSHDECHGVRKGR